jgi:DNA replication protein DnaC
MTREVEVARIEHRRGTGQAFEYGGLQIIHHNLRRDAQGRKGMFVAGEEVLHRLRDGELHVHLPRSTQDHDKKAQASLVIVDEIGYLPIDKHGADLLFQIISQRYERGAILLSTNRAFKHWAEIFNNDTTLTSALLDRLLHHAETCVLEGKSFRAKDNVDI